MLLLLLLPMLPSAAHSRTEAETLPATKLNICSSDSINSWGCCCTIWSRRVYFFCNLTRYCRRSADCFTLLLLLLLLPMLPSAAFHSIKAGVTCTPTAQYIAGAAPTSEVPAVHCGRRSVDCFRLLLLLPLLQPAAVHGTHCWTMNAQRT